MGSSVRFFTCLLQEHNLLLVGLAALICVAGSAITIRLFQKLRASEQIAKAAWLFLGGVAAGATIWSTHFIAMIAYQPGVEVAYEPLLTGASLGIAVLGASLGMSLGSHNRRFALEVGGAMFGLAVATMHYMGMAAFTIDALVTWSPVYVVVSLLASVVFAALAFKLAADNASAQNFYRAIGLVVIAIVALHFTGMAAMMVEPLAPLAAGTTSQTADGYMAVAVTGVCILVLGTGAASHALDMQARALARGRLKEIVEGTVDGMVVELNGVIIAANNAFAELAGVDRSRLAGLSLANWISDLAELPQNALSQTTMTGAEGASIPVELAVRRDSHSAAEGPLMIYGVRDLRARIAQEQKIRDLARNDSLTGLPNRASFLGYLERKTAADSPHARVALLALDLDRFKEVNDFHGHAAGDQLLTVLGERMRTALRPDEFVARLGGDEFVAVAPVMEREDALDLAERLRDAILRPVDLGHAEVGCGVSIGIAIWPDDAKEASTLINDADLAMYRAKDSLAEDICFYEEEMDKAVRHRRRLVQALREALDGNQFELNYQVQAAIETGEVTGYEALLRWRQADGGYISPAEFIPIAEETGLILPIGEWVLRRACAEAAKWPEQHKIAVNLSPVQLAHVDLPRLVHQILLETGLKASRLELEITETAMISDLERTTHILRQLKLLGVSVAMDDFGTGYSSLSTLRAFPFDKIKLDQSFMPHLESDPQSEAIIRAVLALGDSLNIPVLAEGVETVEQLEFLVSQGCDQVQGYLLGRPKSIADSRLLAQALAVWQRDGVEPPAAKGNAA